MSALLSQNYASALLALVVWSLAVVVLVVCVPDWCSQIEMECVYFLFVAMKFINSYRLNPIWNRTMTSFFQQVWYQESYWSLVRKQCLAVWIRTHTFVNWATLLILYLYHTHPSECRNSAKIPCVLCSSLFFVF